MKSAQILAVGCIFLLVSFSAISETAYLYVFFHDDNTSGERFRTELPDMATCLDALKYSKLPMPERPAGDYEVMGAMWCGSKVMHRNYSATWWNDPIQEPSGN